MPLPRLKKSKRNKKHDKKRSTALTLKRIEAVDGMWCEGGDLLNLPGWRTLGYKENGDDMIVLAELTTEPVDPCICGASPSAFQKWGLAQFTYLHDLPLRCKRTRLYYRKQRYRCTKCKKKTFLQPMAGADEQRSLTTRLDTYIKQEGLNLFRTFAHLANEVGYSEQTVRNIVSDYAAELEKARRIETPVWISIDEVHIEGQERCVITDPDGERVIHMLPSNSQAELMPWLLQLPNRHVVKLVTIDMWAPYLGAVERVLPKAIIVIDRYHVHNLLNSAIKGVLSIIRDSLSYSEHRESMRDPKILLASRYHLEEDAGKDEEKTDDRKDRKGPSLVEIRDKWFEDLPDLRTAYWLKEDFSDILQLWDRQKAEELTDLWLGRVEEFIRQLRSKYKGGKDKIWDCPFSNVLITIKKWRPQILNYIDGKRIHSSAVSNSFAEHVNKKLKKAKSLCNGIAFETIRIKAIHGGVMVRRRPRHPLSEPQARLSPKRRGEKTLKINPDSNLQRLKQAREDRDETKDLLPKPQESPGWVSRLGSTVRRSTETPSRPAEARKNEDDPRDGGLAVMRVTDDRPSQPLNPGGVAPAQALRPGGAPPATAKTAEKPRRKRRKPDLNQLTMFLETA